ncbi:LysR substrate-binding domain-containing protein [Sulfitobacter aestuarii]|uniref:LysR substrate-binding domain-containing protein n=1 Tax=Sulfitobacter aestuarii TaxID=2161676 RepID=A0ABW5U209_9RHOB
MNFTLRQLGYFKALADTGNFGRAAIACNISQPALSVQIRSLETALGGRLIERQSRAALLTPLGRQILSQAEDILDRAKQLDATARMQIGLAGTLALGLIPTIAPYLLPGALALLRGQDISLRVEVREAQTDQLLTALGEGSLDAAVMALPSGADGLSETPLFEDRFLLAGSRERMAAGNVTRPTDLDRTPLMLLEDGHCLTDQALEVCQRDRTQAGINTGASSLATLSRLVEAGFGMTLMPEIAARTETDAAPGLRLRRFRVPEPARLIGLVCRASTPKDGWHGALAAVLRDAGLQEQRAFTGAG